MSDPAGTGAGADREELLADPPCGLVATALDGTIQAVNDHLLAVTGHRREHLVGRRFQELLGPGGRIFYETHISPMLRLQGFARELALDLVRADGSALPVLAGWVVRCDADGVPTHHQAFVLDVVERRSYEHELLVSRRRVERLQRITARFAAALDSREVARAALEEIVDGVKADRGVLATLSEPDGRSLHALGTHATTADKVGGWETAALADMPAIEAAIDARAPAFLEDLSGAELGIPGMSDPALPSTRVAVLPLVVEDRPTGVLCLASAEHTSFSHEERSFLVAFAAACAQAADRAQLQEKTELAAHRMAFLSQLSKALDEVISVEDRAQRVVELLVPEYGDLATIEGLEPGAAPIAARHADPELLEPLIALRTAANVGADQPGSLARARQTLEPQLLVDIPEDTYARYDLETEHEALLRRLAPRSYVGLPLLARGRLVGTLMLVISQTDRHFAEHDLPFFADVADRVALGLENARLLEQQRELAHRLQMSLLPGSFPDHDRVEVTALYRPATEALEVGGDWYDAFLIGDDLLGLAVGDVVGHNEAAALVMGRLSTALRAYALEGGGPAATLRRLSWFAESVPGSECSTVAYAELDLRSGVLTYACAGHPPPLLSRPGTGFAPLWDGRSPALALTPHNDPPQASVTMTPGATLLLYTDGLIERRGVHFDKSLGELVARLDALPRQAGAIGADLPGLLSAAPQADDICVMAITVTADGDETPDGPAPTRGAGDRDPIPA